MLSKDKFCILFTVSIMFATKYFIYYIMFLFLGSSPIFESDRVSIDASFSPDSQFILSGSEDGRIYIWNVDSGERDGVLGEHKDHPGPVYSVLLNPKYMMMASAAKTNLAFWLPTI